MKKLLYALLLISITFLGITNCKKDAPKQSTPTVAGDTATNQPVALQVSISPNPCINQFAIQTNAPNGLFMQMFDATGGKKLSQFVFGSVIFNTDSLTAGVYVIRLTTNGSTNTITRRLVVSK